MSTVADDLLNDFGSSGDEADELENDGLVLAEKTTNGDRDAMDVDEDDENEEASDDETSGAMKDMEDTEATKAKVEKMQFGAVKDVRSVASLMQTLEPILEVSKPLIPYPIPSITVPLIYLLDGSVYIVFEMSN
jgi:U4/U6 small nuclear ribonucleoprotein PRP31